VVYGGSGSIYDASTFTCEEP